MADIKNKTLVKLAIPSGSSLTIALTFQQDAAHKVWVDWGDKSYPDTYSYEGLIEAKHTYPATGEYTITMEVVDEGWLVLGGGWTGGNFVGGSDEAVARMLKAVYIGDDVTGIADYAFRGCENLEEITIPKNRDISLGKYAFEGCGSIEEIKLPGNTVTVPLGCFYNCTSLKKVVLPNGVYEIMPFAFYGCASLKEINLQSVTRIDDSAFASCRKLDAVKLGGQCFRIGDSAFANCSNVVTIDLGTAKTIGDRAFYGVKALQALEIPGTVSSIGKMCFAACTSLKSIKMETGNPPVLMSPDAIEPNEELKILVPSGSVRTYINATNWAVFDYAIQEG